MNPLLLSLFLISQPIEVKVIESSNYKWEHMSHLAIGFMNVSQFADLSTTMYMSGKGGFKEANLILAPFYKSPIRMAIVKGGAATLIGYILFKMHKKHPKLVTFISTSIGIGTGYVALKNSRLEKASR